MRVIFDTNILISALFWRGAPYRCLSVVQAGLVDLIMSPPIFVELRRVLQQKFHHSVTEAETVLTLFKEISTTVEISGTLRVIQDDPEDDKFLETAQVANADLIVSGDSHLLKLQEYQGIEIISARRLLELLTTSQQP